MAFDGLLEELKEKKNNALGQGGPERVKKQHDRGRLTARERIDLMLDPGSFVEFGVLACSDMPGMEDKTAADGVIMGYGLLDKRRIALMASDFTVLASTLARVSGKKIHDFKNQIVENRLPFVFLGEGGGGRVPDGQGSIGMASSAMMGNKSIFPMYTHLRVSPVVMATIGQCYGVPMWQACQSDFVVQVKGGTLSVAGVRALKRVIAANYSDEDMGGWKIHAEITGIADQVAEDEKDCFRII
ncbi:MAG: carboxyl transferase domain-containing protein, partial [Thermodesulfobacteriota bacterium]|nr:carboxyl transferase domain-containing protein [Thermodesulfobacteriota bacterium]